MIDDAACTVGPANRAGRECHRSEGTGRAGATFDESVTGDRSSTSHTVRMAANIIYGSGIPGESELRLCGDVSGAKRAVELGVSDWFNSIEFARAGGKAIAVDADPERIAQMRSRADAAEVTVQCIQADLADLGDITSATCEVVVASQTIVDVDDLGRLLRQVHRILKPSAFFVISMPHPFGAVSQTSPYGTAARTISDWFTALERANFRVDQLRELGVGPTQPTPTTLVLRARKEGS